MRGLAAALVLAGIAACGFQGGSGPVADPTLSVPVAVSERDPEVSVPEVSVPLTSAPSVSVPDVSVPEASVPSAEVPAVSVPEVSVPLTSLTSAPSVSVPAVSVPEVSVPEVSLAVVPEHGSDYDRDDWGPHHSDLCRGATGSPDPYTGTPIDICNVDHVVALNEAHQSGGWAWPIDMKQGFSQDPANHVASRACINHSKGASDIFEWSDASIASSVVCEGGYTVTSAGRCFLAATTWAVKSAWDLTVDQAELDTLIEALSKCGDAAQVDA